MVTPPRTPRPSPYTSTLGSIVGSIAAGTPIASSNVGSHSSVSNPISIVREALVTSVM